MGKKKDAFRCTQKGQDVRCECGGQLAVEGTLHPIVDLGMGFVRGQFQIERMYSKKVIGYKGFCLKCRKQGDFLLPQGG